jgi:hypothetical protein
VQREDLAPLAIDDVRQEADETPAVLAEERRMLASVDELSEPGHPCRRVLLEEGVHGRLVLRGCRSHPHRQTLPT